MSATQDSQDPNRSLPWKDRALANVVLQCQEESQQDRSQGEGACFELFCRALDEGDPQAWAAFQGRYSSLVTGWIRSQGPGLSQATVDDLAQETWLAFWRSLTRRSVRVRERFAHIGAALRYLKDCARIAVIEYLRWEQRQRRLLDAWAALPVPSVESLPGSMARREKLGAIQDWIHRTVTDPQEQLLLHLAFERGLKPQEIQRRFPDEFPTVQEVYRVRERILKRARRALASLPRRGVGKSPRPPLSRVEREKG